MKHIYIYIYIILCIALLGCNEASKISKAIDKIAEKDKKEANATKPVKSDKEKIEALRIILAPLNAAQEEYNRVMIETTAEVKEALSGGSLEAVNQALALIKDKQDAAKAKKETAEAKYDELVKRFKREEKLNETDFKRLETLVVNEKVM